MRKNEHLLIQNLHSIEIDDDDFQDDEATNDIMRYLFLFEKKKVEKTIECNRSFDSYQKIVNNSIC